MLLFFTNYFLNLRSESDSFVNPKRCFGGENVNSFYHPKQLLGTITIVYVLSIIGRTSASETSKRKHFFEKSDLFFQ